MKRFLLLLLIPIQCFTQSTITVVPLSTGHSWDDYNTNMVILSTVETEVDSLLDYRNEDMLIGQDIEKYPGGIVYNIDYYSNIDTVRWIDMDTSFYKGTATNQNKPVKINTVQYPVNSPAVVSKVGGLMIRHDNWLGTLAGFESGMYALSNWLNVINKYNLKASLFLNTQEEWEWQGDYEKYKYWWKALQVQGHEVCGHGPEHTNYSYYVDRNLIDVNMYTPGVDTIIASLHNTYYVVMDTSADGHITGEGFDLMLKRERRMFEYIGLSQPTYWGEGGGQLIYYDIDSVWKQSRLNGYIGGSIYDDGRYKHFGYNPPLDWIDEAPYSQKINGDWITFADWEAYGTRKYSAVQNIKKLVDGSAKHKQVPIFVHAQGNDPEDWYLAAIDSLFYFTSQNTDFIKTGTASQWAQWLYHSKTNQYENVIPCNPITGQVFEDNIDAAYGDTVPDGWAMSSGSLYHVTGGSQDSKGYMTISTSGKGVACNGLMGVEKGLNIFAIDVKDKSSSDSIYIDIKEYYGDDVDHLSNRTTRLTYATSAAWVTHTGEVIIHRNTTYINVTIITKTGTAYIDELVFHKKY